MSKRLIIAFDFDDVLVDLIGVVLKHYNEIYGTSVQPGDYYHEDARPWGVETIEQASARFHDIVVSHHDQLKPNTETIAAIKRLSALHELHIVTGRRSKLKAPTEEVVRTYFEGCFTSIELTNFYDAKTRRTKGEVCKQLGADILVDDHIDHLRSVLDSGLKEVILFGDYAWNQGELPRGVKRCVDWPSLEREVERIARQ